MVILKLMDFPILRSLWLYHPSNYRAVSYAAIILFPIGLPLYFIGLYNQRRLKSELGDIIKVAGDVITLLKSDEKDKTTT